MKKERSDIALENFGQAVKKLEEFLANPIEDERDRAGIIQAFEFCYELAWVSLKKAAEDQGLEAPTPIQAFRAAFQMGFITDAEQKSWLEMKKTRNLTSHTYKEALAAEVLKKVTESYLSLFQSLVMRLKNKQY